MRNMTDLEDYANSKFLFYTYWETTTKMGGTIAGSLIHRIFAQTEDEARVAVAALEERSHSILSTDLSTRYRYTYIPNRPEWWGRRS